MINEISKCRLNEFYGIIALRPYIRCESVVGGNESFLQFKQDLTPFTFSTPVANPLHPSKLM